MPFLSANTHLLSVQGSLVGVQKQEYMERWLIVLWVLVTSTWFIIHRYARLERCIYWHSPTPGRETMSAPFPRAVHHSPAALSVLIQITRFILQFRRKKNVILFLDWKYIRSPTIPEIRPSCVYAMQITGSIWTVILEQLAPALMPKRPTRFNLCPTVWHWGPRRLWTAETSAVFSYLPISLAIAHAYNIRI